MIKSHCTKCVTLRWFLASAGALITAIYLQPSWAVRVSYFVPSPLTLGLSICALGFASAAVGLWRMWSDRARIHQPIASKLDIASSQNASLQLSDGAKSHALMSVCTFPDTIIPPR